MDIGPVTREQMARLGATWKQGEHVLITGPTGSGKTALARHVIQRRIDKGGHVVVLAAKPRQDPTLKNDYKGFVRWKQWKKKPNITEDKILLWPDVHNLSSTAAILAHQKQVFKEALDYFIKTGIYTVVIDEGLYFTNRSFLNFYDDVAMMHAMGRSANLTVVTNAQRPSHLPLILYGSASHAFVGRARERVDVERLKELGGRESSKELEGMMRDQGRHDFLWVPVAPDWPSEWVNLRK